MTDTHLRARVAGAIYLAASLPAFFAYRYVAGALLVKGDWAATLASVRAHEALFRAGVGAEVLGSTLWVFVVWGLWRLLGEVDRVQVWLMTALGLLTVPLMFMAVVPELAVLILAADPHYAQAFGPGGLQGASALALRLHGQTLLVAEAFWGAWLFPFGVLVWKSGFLPKLLGALLFVGGAGWLLDCGATILTPQLLPQLEPIASAATRIGELPVIFWLLIMGARTGFSAPIRTAPAAA